jgi:hypothetical protein
MTTLLRRIILVLTAITGSYVGIWAAALPQSFYDSFPGFGFMWVSVDGPFNEHLIRDVGALYLAIGAIAIYAIVAKGVAATRATGIAWVVFGVPHLTYHALHFEGMAFADVVGNVIALGGSLLLGVALLVLAHLEERGSLEPLTLRE